MASKNTNHTLRGMSASVAFFVFLYLSVCVRVCVCWLACPLQQHEFNALGEVVPGVAC